MPVPSPESIGTLSELEARASRRVLDHVWAYIQGGAGEERTLAANRAAFRRWSLRPRAMVDVSTIRPGTTLLGREVAAPFFVAPMAYHREVHPDAELGVAHAARSAGILAAYSTLSSASIEEIGRASGDAPRWFQLYLQPEFRVSQALVERAERAGFDALIVTVDVPVLGVRDRQEVGGFAIDSSVPIGNGEDVVPPPRAPSRQGRTFRLRSEAASTWQIVDDLRSVTRLPVVVKGVLTPEDARLAVDHGARGVLVSNHGGRQLDGVPASLDALPAIAAAVGSRAEVYLDGGVRRASEVLVALALGARAVGIGRPVLWALAVGGGPTVEEYFGLLLTELATSMAIAGRATVDAIDRTLVEPAPPG